MKMHRLLRALTLGGTAALGTLAAASAVAQESYSYFGLSAGRARAHIDEQGLVQGLRGTGLTATTLASDESDTAYKIFGGYQFNRNFGVEVGYFNLGKFGFDLRTLPAGALAGTIKAQGANVDLVGTLPLSENWAVLGRVGAQYAKVRGDFVGSGAFGAGNINSRKSETNGKVGLGLQYTVSPGLLMRAEAERYRINDSVGGHGNVNVVSLSLVFPFGRAAAAPRMAAAAYVAPAYVAPVLVAPPPPPPLVVAAAPLVAPIVLAPVKRRVSFSAESLFGFDQSTLRPEGRSALDRVAPDAQGVSFDSMVVEGHTDRLGSAAYNQRLSASRAASVKTYLVSTGKFDAGKLSAVAKGETEPVTKAGDCKGTQPSPALIACLQPDRRVEVELTGTR